jgi:uncharacterized membrane protein
MKLKVDKLLIISTLICLLPIVLSLIMYDKLPDTMPIHWDSKGNPDGYGSKAYATIGIPLMMAGLNLITHFALVTAFMSILFVYAAKKKTITDTNITGGKK